MNPLNLIKEAITSDKVADIEREIAETESRLAAAGAEVEKLLDEEHQAESIEQFSAIKVKADWFAERARRAQDLLPALHAKLDEAKRERRQADIARWTRQYVSAWKSHRKAVEMLAQSQAALIALADSCRAEIGDGAWSRLPKLVFLGIPLPDAVANWVAHVDREMTVYGKPANPTPRRLPSPIPNGLPGANWMPDRVGGAPAPVAEAAKPTAPRAKPAALPPAPAKLSPRPLLVLDGEPGPGQRAVKYLRSNVELPTSQLSLVGDEAVVPSEIARALVENGAAEFIEIARAASVLELTIEKGE